MINLIGNISNRIIVRESGDAARINNHHTSLNNISIIDVCPDELAHIDGIQLIPPSIGELHNQQYAGANLKGVSIKNSSIFSQGKMQGLFCSDGLLEDVDVDRLMVDTQSQHKVTLGGVISGSILNVTDGNGERAPIVLNPLRLGGGIANIWVLSFAGDLRYNQINGCEHITDNRMHKQPGINLVNFDYYLFRYAVESLPYPQGENATARYCEQLKEMALSFGEVV